MAVSTIDTARRPGARVTALLMTAVSTLVLLGKRAVAPHQASLTNLANIPLTVAGFGCVDFAAFHLAHGWGWLVTGLSLMLLEHLIADDAS